MIKMCISLIHMVQLTKIKGDVNMEKKVITEQIEKK